MPGWCGGLGVLWVGGCLRRWGLVRSVVFAGWGVGVCACVSLWLGVCLRGVLVVSVSRSPCSLLGISGLSGGSIRASFGSLHPPTVDPAGGLGSLGVCVLCCGVVCCACVCVCVCGLFVCCVGCACPLQVPRLLSPSMKIRSSVRETRLHSKVRSAGGGGLPAAVLSGGSFSIRRADLVNVSSEETISYLYSGFVVTLVMSHEQRAKPRFLEV